MTEVFLADVGGLNDPLESPALLGRVCQGRREKISKFACAEDRIRSLGAGLLLEEVFPLFGVNVGEIYTGRGGKPMHPKIGFNLSHSGEKVMLAISVGAVGCDLEKGRKIPARMSERLPKAREYLERFPQEEREKEFFRLWTMRESYLKMTGEGISGMMGVSFLPGESIFRKGVFFHEYFSEGYAIFVCAEEESFGTLKEISIR